MPVVNEELVEGIAEVVDVKIKRNVKDPDLYNHTLTLQLGKKKIWHTFRLKEEWLSANFDTGRLNSDDAQTYGMNVANRSTGLKAFLEALGPIKRDMKEWIGKELDIVETKNDDQGGLRLKKIQAAPRSGRR